MSADDPKPVTRKRVFDLDRMSAAEDSETKNMITDTAVGAAAGVGRGRELGEEKTAGDDQNLVATKRWKKEPPRDRDLLEQLVTITSRINARVGVLSAELGSLRSMVYTKLESQQETIASIHAIQRALTENVNENLLALGAALGIRIDDHTDPPDSSSSSSSTSAGDNDVMPRAEPDDEGEDEKEQKGGNTKDNPIVIDEEQIVRQVEQKKQKRRILAKYGHVTKEQEQAWMDEEIAFDQEHRAKEAQEQADREKAMRRIMQSLCEKGPNPEVLKELKFDELSSGHFVIRFDRNPDWVVEYTCELDSASESGDPDLDNHGCFFFRVGNPNHPDLPHYKYAEAAAIIATWKRDVEDRELRKAATEGASAPAAPQRKERDVPASTLEPESPSFVPPSQLIPESQPDGDDDNANNDEPMTSQ